MAKAGRAGRSETARAKLRRIVQAAAATARTDNEFFAAIEAYGALVRPRPSTTSTAAANWCLTWGGGAGVGVSVRVWGSRLAMMRV
jgi:hypothetical protein